MATNPNWYGCNAMATKAVHSLFAAVAIATSLFIAGCGGVESPPDSQDVGTQPHIQVNEAIKLLTADAAAPDEASSPLSAEQALAELNAEQASDGKPERLLQKADASTTKILGIADFDGDGKSDVLWKSSTGLVQLSLMNGTKVAGCATLGTFSSTFMGTGDFNGDGMSDIVWRNMSTGAVTITLMNGGTIIQTLNVGQTPIALNVKLEGIGDFDGNGRSDMLWRNQSTGRAVMSYHNSDGSVSSWPTVSNYISLSTSALKVGDINGDGKDDIVWRNMSSGNVVISLMSGSYATWKTITSSPISLNVSLEAIGDFDNNGRADLLWRNKATGRSLMSYHSSSGGVLSWPVVSEYINPVSTSAVGVGDFNGDGRSDILWRNLATGNSVISLMNGNAATWYAISFTACTRLVQHTGITNAQCLEQNNETSLVACTNAAALGLNSQQDGHRRTMNAMAFSALGTYPTTSCVRDKVTGLIWEGKEATGIRAGDKLYTHLDSQTALQKYITSNTNQAYADRFSASTSSEIAAITNSVGYVNYVNGLKLCGFTDWRLPTQQELLGLLNFGNTVTSRMDTDIFRNTLQSNYWTANGVNRNLTVNETNSLLGNLAWIVHFGTQTPTVTDVKKRAEVVDGVLQPGAAGIRLVRGTPWSGSRYSYVSVTYAGDATNNVVQDNQTALQWRRCPEGQTWNGSTCTGTPLLLNHAAALQHAQLKTGWRMPSAKELASILEIKESQSEYTINTTAFPMTSTAAEYFWSATPHYELLPVWTDAGGTQSTLKLGAYDVHFGKGGGALVAYPRASYFDSLRLVRDMP